jgi:hypothetical protein
MKIAIDITYTDPMTLASGAQSVTVEIGGSDPSTGQELPNLTDGEVNDVAEFFRQLYADRIGESGPVTNRIDVTDNQRQVTVV